MSMRRVEEVAIDEPFEDLLTIKELAATLGVSYKRSAAIVQEKELPFRFATKKEEDTLMETGRIDGLPATHPPCCLNGLVRDVLVTCVISF